MFEKPQSGSNTSHITKDETDSSYYSIKPLVANYLLHLSKQTPSDNPRNKTCWSYFMNGTWSPVRTLAVGKGRCRDWTWSRNPGCDNPDAKVRFMGAIKLICELHWWSLEIMSPKFINISWSIVQPQLQSPNGRARKESCACLFSEFCWPKWT